MIKFNKYFLLLIFLIINNNLILSLQKKHVRHISIEDTEQQYSINNDLKNDYVIKFLEKNKYEDDNLEIISLLNKNKRSNKLKIASYICDGSYKVINTGFIITIAILGYYLILNLNSGCNTMHNACNQCTYNLENAENAINMVKNFTNLISNILKVCPKGKEDIMNGFVQFFKDCC